MGNVSSNVSGSATDVVHVSSKPLPPLPDNNEGEYDIDSPPPYPPPPPPMDDSSSRRSSWKVMEGNVFKNRKSGSWIVPAEHQYNVSSKALPELGLSDTLALDDSSIVTVRYFDSDDKLNINTPEYPQNHSWGSKNIQMVLNSELSSGQGTHSQVNGTHNINGVNNYSGNIINSSDIKLTPTLNSKDITYQSTPKHENDNKKFNTIRLDYPEGSVRTITNYKDFDISKCSADVSPIGSSRTSSMSECDENKSTISNASIESIESPKKRSFNFGPCFGESKPKKARLELEKDSPTVLNSCDIDAALQTSNIEVKAESKIKPKKQTKKKDNNLSSPKNKSGKKADLTSCFGKSKNSVVSSNSFNDPDVTSENNIELDIIEIRSSDTNISNADVNIVKSGSKHSVNDFNNTNGHGTCNVNGADVQFGTNIPKLEPSNKNINASIEKRPQKKLDLGSCFGKGKELKKTKNKQQDISGSVEGNNEVIAHNSEPSLLPVTVKGNIDQTEELELKPPNIDLPKINIDLQSSSSNDIGIQLPKNDTSLDISDMELEGSTEIHMPKNAINLSNDFETSHKLDQDVSLQIKEPVDISAVASYLDKPVTPEMNVSASLSAPEDKSGLDVEFPLQEEDIQMKTSAELVLATPDASISKPELKGKQEKYSALSCFGKSKSNKDSYGLTAKNDKEDNVHDAEITVKTPDIDAECDIKTPHAKFKKGKSRPTLGACFGKTSKADADVISSLPAATVETNISVDTPSSVATVELEPPVSEAKTSDKKSKPKSKTSLGSCFGKKNEIGTSAEGSLPEIEAKRSSKQISLKTEPKLKPSSGVKLSSCFGKQKESHNDLKTDAADNVQIDVGSDAEIHSDLPTPKIEGSIEIPSLQNDSEIEVTPPSLNISKINIGMEGSSSHDIDVEIPSINGTVNLPKTDVETIPDISINNADINMPIEINGIPEVDYDLSLQTSAPMNIHAEIIPTSSTLSELEYSVDIPIVPAPKMDISGADISVDMPGTNTSNEVIVDTPDISIEKPKLKPKKGAYSGLSCFGKSKKNKSKEMEGEDNSHDIDIKHESHQVSGKCDIKVPDAKMKTKETRTNLGSCFGKSTKPDTTVSTSLPATKVEPDIDVEVSLPEADIEVEPAVAKTEIKSVKKSTSKNNLSFGSCLGKKKSANASIEGPELKTDCSSSQIESKTKPKVNVNSGAKLGSCFGNKKKSKCDIKDDSTGNLDIRTDAELQPSMPMPDTERSVDISTTRKDDKQDKGTKFNLGSCFGKVKTPKENVDYNKGDTDVSLEGNVHIPTVSSEITVPDLNVEGKVEQEILEVTGPSLYAPKIDIGLEGSCSEDIDTNVKVSGDEINIPKVELKNNSNASIPEVDVNISSELYKMPAVDHDISLQTAEPTHMDAEIVPVSMNLSSLDMSADIPTVPDSKIDISSSDISIDASIEKKSREIGIDTPTINLKKPKMKTTKGKASNLSCFGKSKTSKDKGMTVEGDLSGMELTQESSGLTIEGGSKTPDHKFKKKKVGANLGSCFGKLPKSDVAASTARKADKSGRIDASIPEETIKSPAADADIKIDKKTSPKFKSSLGSCFGKKNSVGASAEGTLPEIETEGSSKPIEVSGKSKLKPAGGAMLGSCFGNKKNTNNDFKGAVNADAEVGTDMGVGSKLQMIEVEGSAELPTVKKNKQSSSQKKSKKLDLTSCFAKGKGSKKGKIGSNIEDPAISLEGNACVLSSSSGINVPDIAVDGVVEKESIEIITPNIRAPKVHIGLQGSSSQNIDAELPATDISINIPKVDLEGSSDLSITDNDINLSTDVDVIHKVDDNLSVQVISPTNINVETSQLSMNLPTLDSSLSSPKMDVSTPEISVDISGVDTQRELLVDTPDITLKKPKFKSKKGKMPDLSCFGKSKTNKGEKSEAEDSSQDTDNVHESGINTELNINTSGAQIKGKKPRVNFGSCFGKPSKTDADVSTSIPVQKAEASTDLETPLPKVDIPPSDNEDTLVIKKPSPKVKTSLGSCFGKKNSVGISAEGSLPDIETEGTPKQIEVKSTSKIKPTGAARFGSCFGNKGRSENDHKKELRSGIAMDAEVHSDLTIPEAEGSVEIISLNKDQEYSKQKKKKLDLGSCFGKGKVSKGDKLECNVDTSSIPLDGTAIIPSTSGDIKLPAVAVDGEVEHEIIQVITPNLSTPIVNIGLEGKSSEEINKKLPNIDCSLQMPTVELKENSDMPMPERGVSLPLEINSIPDVDYDLSVKTEIPTDINSEITPVSIIMTTVDASIDTPTITDSKVEVSIPDISTDISGRTPSCEVAVNIHDVSTRKPELKSKKGTISGLSCFGKSKSKTGKGKKVTDEGISTGTENIHGTIDISTERDIKKPDEKNKIKKQRAKLGSCFGKPNIKASSVPVIKDEVRVEVDTSLPEAGMEVKPTLLKADKKSNSKMKASLGSCLGKKKSVEVSPEGSEIKTNDRILHKQSKDKKVNLSSCFGKGKTPKGKCETSIDKQTFSMESKTNIPSVSSEISAPGLNVDGIIEQDTLEVAGPSLSFPKVNVLLEGKSSQDIEVDVPTSEGLTNIPTVKLEGDSEIFIPQVDINISPDLNDMPKVDYDTSLQTTEPMEIDAEITPVSMNLPSLDVSAEIPVESVSKVDVGSSDISLDVSDIRPSGKVEVNVPEVSLKNAKIKTSKEKTSGLSCFGKSKTRKERKAGVNAPDVEIVQARTGINGECDINVPVVKSKTKTPRTNLGSCFGKASKPNVEASLPETKAEASIRVDASLPEAAIEVKSPVTQVDTKVAKKSTYNKKGSLTSCFGKNKSADASTKGSLPVTEIEGSSKSIEIKSKQKLKPMEGAKLGSCFGNKKKSNIDHKTEIADDIDADIIMDVEMSSDLPKPEVEGSVEISSIKKDLENNKQSQKKLDLGSCFGKRKVPKGGKFKDGIDTPSVSLEGTAIVPSASSEIKIHAIAVDGEVEQEIIQVTTPHLSTPVVNIGLEGKSSEETDAELSNIDCSVQIPKFELKDSSSMSAPECDASLDFGINDIPKVEYDISLQSADPKLLDTEVTPASLILPSFDASTEASIEPVSKIEVDSPYDTSANMPSVSAEGNIKVDAPDISIEKPELKAKKGSVNGLSCFGKSKSKTSKDKEVKIECNIPDVDTTHESTECDIKTPEDKIKKKKPRPNIGSCFGKPSKRNVEITSSTPAAKVETSLDPTLPESVIEVSPVVSVENKKGSKKTRPIGKASLGSCFGKKNDVGVGTKGSQSEIDKKSSPKTTEIKAKTNLNETRGVNLRACFGNKKGTKGDLKVEGTGHINTSVDVDTTLICDMPKSDIEGSVEIPSIKMEHEPIKENKMKKLDLGSCFGKGKVHTGKNVGCKVAEPSVSIEGKTGIPSTSSEINAPTVAVVDVSPGISVDLSDANTSGTVIVEEPDVAIRKSDIKSNKSNNISSLSCFGKSKNSKGRKVVEKEISPHADIKHEGDISTECDIKTPDAKFKEKKPRADLRSCFGKPPESDVDISTSVPVPEAETSVRIDASLPKEPSNAEADIKITKRPASKMKASLGSCLGKKNSVGVSAEGSLPDIEMEASSKKPEKITKPKLKAGGSAKLGDCFGNKKKSNNDSKTEAVGGVNIDLGTDREAHYELSRPKTEESVGTSTVTKDNKYPKKVHKKKLDLASCFGKGKVQKDIKLESKVDDPSVSLEGKVKSPSTSSDIIVPVLNIDGKTEQVITEVVTPGLSMPTVNIGLDGNSSPDINSGLIVSDGSVSIPKGDLNFTTAVVNTDGDVILSDGLNGAPEVDYDNSLQTSDSVNFDTRAPICANMNSEITFSKGVDGGDFISDNNFGKLNSEHSSYEIHTGNCNVCNQESKLVESTNLINALHPDNGLASRGDISVNFNRTNLPDVIEANIPRLLSSQMDVGDSNLSDNNIDKEYQRSEEDPNYDNYTEFNTTEKTKYFSVPSISDSISEDIAETVHTHQVSKEDIEDKKGVSDVGNETSAPQLPVRWYNVDTHQNPLPHDPMVFNLPIPNNQLVIDSHIDPNTRNSSHSSKETLTQSDADIPSTLTTTSPFVSSLSDEILKEFIKDNDSEIGKVVHQMNADDQTESQSTYFNLDITTKTTSSSNNENSSQGIVRTGGGVERISDSS